MVSDFGRIQNRAPEHVVKLIMDYFGDSDRWCPCANCQQQLARTARFLADRIWREAFVTGAVAASNMWVGSVIKITTEKPSREGE